MYDDMQLILPGKPLRFRQAVVVILLPDAHTAGQTTDNITDSDNGAMVSQPFASVAAPLTMGITRMETTWRFRFRTADGRSANGYADAGLHS